MRAYRSMLFIPGNKPSWMEKAGVYGADALILDLEDSVPYQEKVASRPLVKNGVKALAGTEHVCYVRVNGFATGLTFDDLDGVLCPELRGILLPKVGTIEDVKELDTLMSHLEKRKDIPARTIEIILGLETAKAMRNAYEIALSCPRISTIIMAAGPRGDANRAIGYTWSKEGKETLYLRSKAVLDSRAAGIMYPLISSWWDIKDLDGLRQDALRNRQLGFRGQVVIHPSHVPIVNDVFTPTAEEIAYCRGLIRAMEEGERKGVAAVVYEGDMVDYAMVKTAREMLKFAASIGMET